MPHTGSRTRSPGPPASPAGAWACPPCGPCEAPAQDWGWPATVSFMADDLTWELQPLPSRTASHSKNALAHYTIGGYISDMRKDIKASCAKRLNRIEGQVRGIARMVADDRYCIDVVTQISAVRAALRRLEEEILRDHVGHCVEHAIASGNKADQRRKIEELMNVVGRAER
jgi:DNA-binding FrmR family transcriptional regulator